MDHQNLKTIALIGGGPAALFMLKHISNAKLNVSDIYIFEKKDRLGVGMPYGKAGAEHEHVANVSANELPEMDIDFENFSARFNFDGFKDFYKDDEINSYKVIPRLLLGNYLEFSFKKYLERCTSIGAKVHIHTGTEVLDVFKDARSEVFKIKTQKQTYNADIVVLCTGHHWPKINEDKVEGWYDSPYPPSKLHIKANFPVAVKGASLTAVDAVKTLARANGSYSTDEEGNVTFSLAEGSEDFRIDLYSLHGFLPALRFHTEDDAYSTKWTMTLEEIFNYKQNHGGFVNLDYVFDRNFKQPLSQKDPAFYNKIKDLSIEDFVDKMLSIREELDSFQLFEAEFKEAEKSIHRHQSVAWKEALSAFSYAMNYPAKHFSAEDMLRLKKTLMPLISIIIASLPQSSYHEMMALHKKGILNTVTVDEESSVVPSENGGCIYKFKNEAGENNEIEYKIYVDATGQKPILFNQLPFESLKEIVTPGFLYFKDEKEGESLTDDKNVGRDSSGKYFLKVPGLAINDYFQALDSYGVADNNLYIMSVPMIGGLNPDYSGLDFCDTAAERIVKKLSAAMNP